MREAMAASLVTIAGLGVGGLYYAATKPGGRSWREHAWVGGRGKVVVKGTVEPGFEGVRDEFQASFEEGRDVASQLAVYHRGKLVVDLWAGDARIVSESGLADGPIAGDVVGVIYSCTKVAESLVMAMLADRGLLDFGAPIAQYWPDFAVNGKGSITVQQLMRHQAGLCALDETIPLEELTDTDKTRLSQRLAQQKPHWDVAAGNPTRQFYHATTRGLYASEIVRRVDPQRRTLGQFFREEVAEPLELPFFIGITPEERRRSRIMCLLGPNPSMLWKHIFQSFASSKEMRMRLTGGDPHDVLEDWEAANLRNILSRALRGDMKHNKLTAKSLVGVVQDITSVKDPSTSKGAVMQAIELPSANGIANARAMAKLAALMATAAGPDNPLFKTEAARQQALEVGPKLLDEGLNMEIAYTSAGWGFERFLPNFIGWAGAGDAVMQWSEEYGGVGFGLLPTLTYGRVHKPRGVRLMKAVVQAAGTAGQSRL